MLQHRPVVGVIACGRTVEGEPAQIVKHRYIEAIERYAEAIPLIIPSNQAHANALDVVSRVDAVVLTGSNSNIEPRHYGARLPAQAPIDQGRDRFSQALIHAAITAAKPLFGICRGLQEINVALGGTLRDLRDGELGGAHHAPADVALDDMFAFGHPVDVVAGGMLHRFAETRTLDINSVHFQAIDRLAEGLVVDAVGRDGVIEAVSASHTPAPVFAVQWHPEWRPESRPHDMAFWHYLGKAAQGRYLPAPRIGDDCMTAFETRLFINGEFVAGQGPLETVREPATGKTLAEVASASLEQVEQAVTAANGAYKDWSRRPPRERSAALLAIASAIDARLDVLAEVESRNAGKPLRFVKAAELANVADVFRFFGTAVRNMPAPAAGNYRSSTRTSLVRRDPIGVVAQIAPWNYPLLMAAWKIAPAIAAGNAVVIKPSELTPLSLLALCQIFADTLPAGVVNVVCGNGPDVGHALISHDLVRMISLTGDVRTGRAVLQAAAGPMIKRTHLELGGKAPVIVCEDADLDKVVETLREASFYNAGQDCTAACRIFAHASVAQGLTDRLQTMIGSLVYGRPEREDVEFGPLISARQRERVDGFVSRAQAEGFDVMQGAPCEPDGFFFAPTLVAAPIEAEVVQKEVFGPVVSLTQFDDVQTAVDWANASEYGLGSSVWSGRVDQAMEIANALEYGVTWINTHGVMASEMPHGGMKNSGYGSDLSMQSLIDYTQIRHLMLG
ncbi:MAG TPA: aminobutyraldehyde dehydrogenase [Devosia sp.]|jgi:aminobutyraldehyde dehydrogenase|nr:aminobutyraldehyde dehydrogenase [Devosia sp.]